MLESLTSRATRTVLAVATATTVGMTGLAGAAQAGEDDDYDKYKSKKVEVTICKKVRDKKDDEHGYGHGDKSKDKKFRIHVETDKDYKEFKVKDDYCEMAYLRYRDGEVEVEEDRKHRKDYKVTYKVHKGDDYEIKDGKLTVYFDEDKKRPKVRVTVINKEKRDRGYYKSQV